MAGAGAKPGERRGGRQKGTPNKLTADIKATLRLHGQEMVDALLKLTKSDDERVRLGAIQTALDRGYGKAAQHIEAELSVYDRLSLAEQQALLAALEGMDVADEGELVEVPALVPPGKLTGNGSA